MTSPRLIALMAAAVLSLSACDRLKAPDTPPETAVEPAPSPSPDAGLPVRPEAVESTAGIDWEAARRDMASVPREQRETSFQVASGDNAAPVPVLLPTGIVLPQGAESGVKFQPMSDGYFATYPGVDYDIIVNGTNEVIGARETGEEPGETDMTFLATASGAQVAFSRYGADYLVEFECKHTEGAAPTCISAEEALEIVRKLVIAGTR